MCGHRVNALAIMCRFTLTTVYNGSGLPGRGDDCCLCLPGLMTDLKAVKLLKAQASEQ